MPEQHLERRVAERDSARRRQKLLTRVVAVVATALAGIFAGLAAQKATAHMAASTHTVATPKHATEIPPAPTLGAAPAAPVQTPVATSSPPVVVSGGS